MDTSLGSLWAFEHLIEKVARGSCGCQQGTGSEVFEQNPQGRQGIEGTPLSAARARGVDIEFTLAHFAPHKERRI